MSRIVKTVLAVVGLLALAVLLAFTAPMVFAADDSPPPPVGGGCGGPDCR
jgi:hypothetical protein